jgi:hypothetical protein
MVDQTQSEIRIVAPAGMLGAGFRTETFATAMEFDPHFIGCDAGTTDAGPYFLGSGRTSFGHAAIRRDLHQMIVGARARGVPLIIGSCGGGGTNSHVDTVTGMAREILKAEGLSARLAVLKTEPDRDLIVKRMREDRVHALYPEIPVDEDDIRDAAHVVGMIGAEPFIHALEDGADIIIAGRASDTAIFAAYPLWKGYDPGLSWHLGKILECGAACVVQRGDSDCMMARLQSDHFDLIPPNPAMRCSTQSVAAHSLYENADPFRLVEATGVVDVSTARYEAVDDRVVRVSGTSFQKTDGCTVKLEGARLVGYQSVVIAGVRDSHVLDALPEWETILAEKVAERMTDIDSACKYRLKLRIYGRDGVMGQLEPNKRIVGYEVGLVIEATSDTQDAANTVAGIARHKMLHLPVKRWSGFITGIACLHNPPQLERGPVYEFMLNHTMEVDHPMETVNYKMITLGY